MTDFPLPPTPRKVRLSRRQSDLVSLFFGSVTNSAITLISAAILWMILPPVWSWAVTQATFHGDAETCRAAAGACWAFIKEKLRFFLFGMFPVEERPRAVIALLLMTGITVLCMIPRLWGRWLALLWLAVMVAVFWLLLGGAGLSRVRPEEIGGLPLTMLLTLVVLPLGFPLGLILALGRQSELWFYRHVSIGVIEFFRGAPLIATLFMASIMLPFFMPFGLNPPKLARAILAIVLVAGAYMAEAIRGGLQAVPDGQVEAAAAIGMKRWQILSLVVLPQAIRHAIPGLVTIVVLFFKDTSLIIVIGMTDFLGAVQLASRDPEWLGFNIEGYVFAALFYFTVCTILARYAVYLELRQARF